MKIHQAKNIIAYNLFRNESNIDKKVKKSGPSWSLSLDLQLPVQSVPITTKVVNSKQVYHGENKLNFYEMMVRFALY
jgi:hypothetical protein